MALAVVADGSSSRLRLSKRSLPIPENRISTLSLPTLVKRQSSIGSSTDSASTGGISCGPKDTTGPCERSITSSTNTVPIVLGVVIPLGIAFIVLIILHRRHVAKLRKEDAEDKTKSWDWGMDGVAVSEKKGRHRNARTKGTEMSAGDAVEHIRHDRGGISMDMGLNSPYLLPPELHRSHESLRSLSRSGTVGDDKYRQTDFIPDDGSIRSPSSLKNHWDNSSIYTGSSSRPRMDSESTKPLIREPTKSDEQVPTIRKPLPVAKDTNPGLLAPTSDDAARDSYVSNNSSNGNGDAFRASNNYLGNYISGGQQQHDVNEHEHNREAVPELDSSSHVEKPEPVLLKDQPGKRTSVVPDTAGFNFGIPNGVQELPARYSTHSASHGSAGDRHSNLPQFSVTSPDHQDMNHHQQGTKRQSSVYEENFATFSNHPNAYAWPADRNQPHPEDESHAHAQTNHYDQPQHYDEHAVHSSEHQNNDYYDEYPSHPQEQHYDHPNEYQNHNQEQYNANGNTQSLYPNARQSQDRSHRSSQRTSDLRGSHVDYYDDEDSYDLAAYQDVLGYDPRMLTMGMRPLPPDDPTENPEERANRIRSFYKEYFDEVSKPGGGNRLSYFPGNSNQHDNYYAGSQSSRYGSRNHSMSRPATQQQRHRAMSNGSYGPRAFSSASGRYGRPAYKVRPKLPPPKELNILPSAYKLTDDSMLPNPMDYAPPQVFKNQRSGTPDSLRGGTRPYSPSTRAFNPLVSSFDDLAALPSPHQLRKSSTFTSLDFAPPRFQPKDTMSETGSIRSNRSGVSALHQHNIRTGAYRVSRIPKNVAGTKDELASALRPQWGMGR